MHLKTNKRMYKEVSGKNIMGLDVEILIQLYIILLPFKIFLKSKYGIFRGLKGMILLLMSINAVTLFDSHCALDSACR